MYWYIVHGVVYRKYNEMVRFSIFQISRFLERKEWDRLLIETRYYEKHVYVTGTFSILAVAVTMLNRH